jgi:hypothetical protein
MMTADDNPARGAKGVLRALIRKFRSVREKAFKTCTMCRHPWPCRDDFIDDPSLKVFDHLSCKTTLSLSADLFRDLYDGPVYTERKTGTDECPGYCLDKEELRPCPAECECAYVRDILNIIVSRKTAGTELPA